MILFVFPCGFCRMRRLKIVAPGTRRSAIAQPALCLFSLQGWELTYFDKAVPDAGDALETDAPPPPPPQPDDAAVRASINTSTWTRLTH